MQTVRSTVGAHLGAPELVLHKITDVGQQATLKAVLRELSCDDARILRFPGANPVSLDTSHFPRLRKEPYYACEKTDGVRMLLVCYTAEVAMDPPLAPNSRPVGVVVVIDRALAAYVVPIAKVPKAMFQGTMLDGELAWNHKDRTWDYLVFDAVSVSGVPVLDTPLPTRLKAAHRALGTYSFSPNDPIRLHMKSFVACDKLSTQLEPHIGKMRQSYDVDGIILTPARTPVVYGRHTGMFKLKFDEKHTVDFLVAPDKKGLCVFDARRHVVVGTLRPEVFGTPGSIVECVMVSPGVWDITGVRTDKTTANDMLTYQKTLLNMREKLTLSDVVRVFDS